MNSETTQPKPRTSRAATRKTRRLYIVLAGMSMLSVAAGLTLFAMFFGRAPCRFGGQTAPQTLQAYLDKPPGGDDLPTMPESVAR